ncbi:Crp/Fnr family transcriptional regulator [Desulforamulus aquiferis]|uniref:Crp/Fnr family transcriptional regulator n=1 Tax=Desulforamulus aquiferis TaxID=1397668 RepID=A0AAW7ZGL3_9FIRM|nr:Crp/Fnr family transcriptional regulator [Desulforamulus aquiferis]
MFGVVQPKEIKKYRKYFQELIFNKKDIVFYPGKYPNSIFLILDGKVRVFLNYNLGKEFTLTVLESGDVYSGHTRAFGQAITDVKIALIPIEVFRAMLTDLPGLVFGLVNVLGDALKGSIDVIEGLVFDEAGMRLIALLQEWSRDGETTDEGILIRLELTREEMSSMIGSTRQTLANIFKELSRAGLVELKQKKLLIKDFEGLKAFYK